MTHTDDWVQLGDALKRVVDLCPDNVTAQELVATARGAPNPREYLDDIIDQLSLADDTFVPPAALEKQGVLIRPVFRTIKPNDDRWRAVLGGYVLARADERGRRWFYGHTLQREHYANNLPATFNSREQAAAAGLELLAREKRSADRNRASMVHYARLKVPVDLEGAADRNGDPEAEQRIQLVLNSEQQRIFAALFAGLRSANVEFNPRTEKRQARPVSSDADVVRYLLDAIGKECKL